MSQTPVQPVASITGPVTPRLDRLLPLLVLGGGVLFFAKRLVIENALLPGLFGAISVDFMLLFALLATVGIAFWKWRRDSFHAIKTKIRALPPDERPPLLVLHPHHDELDQPALHWFSFQPCYGLHNDARPTYEQITLRPATISLKGTFWSIHLAMFARVLNSTDSASMLLFASIMVGFVAALFSLVLVWCVGLCSLIGAQNNAPIADAAGITFSRTLRSDDRWEWSTTSAVLIGTTPKSARVLLCDHEQPRLRSVSLHHSALPDLLGVLHAAQLERQRRAAAPDSRPDRHPADTTG